MIVLAYWTVAVAFCLTGFLCFIFTLSSLVSSSKRMRSNIKIKDIPDLVRQQPIKSTITGVSFMIFFGEAVTYLIPLEITPMLLFRGVVFRVPLMFSLVGLFYASILIEDIEDMIRDRILKERVEEVRVRSLEGR